MKIYRCCNYAEFYSYRKGQKYLKPFGRGTNTFNYTNNNYIHFFLFAENAYHYSKYDDNKYTKYFIECDIPLEILKKYYGFGWYERIITGYYTPIIEFAIPYEEFNLNYIRDTSNTIKSKWFRPQKWHEYLNNIPQKYLSDYEFGFLSNEKSILEIPIENLIGTDFEISKINKLQKLLKKYVKKKHL